MGRKPKHPAKLTVGKLKKEYPFFKVLQLKPMEIRFVYYYCAGTGMTNAECCRKAGYKGGKQILANRASLLLKRVNVREAIRQFFDIVLNVYKDKLEKEIFDIVYKQMTYDPFMFITKEGKPAFETEDDIPKEWRCCIKGIKTKLYGKEFLRITEIELVDRNQAIEKMAKYITMFQETVNVKHDMSEETRNKLQLIFGQYKGTNEIKFPKIEKVG